MDAKDGIIVIVLESKSICMKTENIFVEVVDDENIKYFISSYLII